MNEQLEKTEDFLDVDFGSAIEYETLPTGSYDLEITDLSIKEKSENKRRSDWQMKVKEKPETTLESIDAYQWVFTFRVIAGEYEGETLTERMTRSFHENSKAGKLAAAALGMPKYNVMQARQMAEQAGVKGSALLMGKRVRAFVTDDEDTQGRHWNNIKEISIIPAPRPRPTRAPQPTPVTPDPAVILGDDFWPEDGTPTA